MGYLDPNKVMPALEALMAWQKKDTGFFEIEYNDSYRASPWAITLYPDVEDDYNLEAGTRWIEARGARIDTVILKALALEKKLRKKT